MTNVATNNAASMRAAFKTRFPSFENRAADDCNVMEEVDDKLHVFKGCLKPMN